MLINYTMWYLINSAFFMVQIFQSQDFQVSRILGFSRSMIFWVQVFEGPSPESGSGVFNHFHNILRLLDVLPNFVTYKRGIYELPQELLNNLRLRILGNEEISGKCLNLIK